MKTSFDKAMDKAREQDITEVKFHNCGEEDHKEGWAFSIYWKNRPYPNFISSKVKTNKGAVRNFCKYINTGKFSLYGNAE